METYQFRNVDGNLSRADSDTESVDDAADNEHRDVLRGANDDGANAPVRFSQTSQ